MATEKNDNPIENINEAWEGHRREHVEAAIKAEFARKVGDLYYDPQANRYLCFADVASREAYLAAPEDNVGLLLGTFDAPFNYSAEINLETPRYNAILTGTTGHYIDFTFDTKNKSGQSVGEDVNCTITIVRGSVRKTVHQKYLYGSHVHLSVDEWLDAGTTVITIGITGVQSLAATTFGVTFQMVSLSLTDTLDIAREYAPGDTIAVPYEIAGYGMKTLEWYLDGVPLEAEREDEVSEAQSTRTKYITAPDTGGVHSLQFRAYTVINGERFYSETLYRDVLVRDESVTADLIGVAMTLPLGEPPFSSLADSLYGAVQYTTVTFGVAALSPRHAATIPVEVYVGGELRTTLELRGGEAQECALTLTESGATTLLLKAGEVERQFTVDVEKTNTTLEEIDRELLLDLRATGKSNTAADRAQWRYGDITTAFTGFAWDKRSGWNEGMLNLADGAAIEIKYNPLREDVTKKGLTLELEFSVSNVLDEDAVVCDLRGADGTGLLMTASALELRAASGERLRKEYKPGEVNRIALVINPKEGVTYKSTMFVYENGVRSGGTAYGTNFTVDSATSMTFASSEDVSVHIRHLRVSGMALTADQVLNNYALYRPTTAEMLKVYDRNNVLEEGSTALSVEALSRQLPVLIITGNMPEIEATTDKNRQIVADIQYINLQNPELSFTMENAVITPQGTSSMDEPIKNTRMYTMKRSDTVLRDANGNVVPSKLYSFKAGAQPVHTWCFKADYAESSGTHNTGVARIWNDVMRDAQIDGEYKLRTKAQQAAMDAGYEYDVRTTIDGFPVVIFYRLDANSPLVFLGKYNFNNDKSTESVFGFRDIPGFDNSKTECWEVLSNGHDLALFKTTDNWDDKDNGWKKAFEGRYPDENQDTAALKGLCDWMSTVADADFSTEKYEHLDVYKVAAYYVYLMRFGAVDQVVKNAMLTTEDGAHWFFINYDNDTVLGLRNDGPLAFGPDITRESKDSAGGEGAYAYAGHESRLWNMLEADADFMAIVKKVDNALYNAGLSYAGVCKMFDEEQAGHWCERVYNRDADFKYLEPYIGQGINNLYKMQGNRTMHRRRWLSERFSMFDAAWVSGEYKANNFMCKLSNAPSGLEFAVTAGQALDYGYGINNEPVKTGIALAKGASHTFATEAVLNVGDPLRIYAAPYLEGIDIHSFAPYLADVDMSGVSSARLGTRFKTLSLGSSGSENNILEDIKGLPVATALEDLNIEGYRRLTRLNLSGNGELRTLRAVGSGLTTVDLPDNAPLETVQLPASLQSLRLKDIKTAPAIVTGTDYAATPGLYLENNGAGLREIAIENCPGLDTATLVRNWMTSKTTDSKNCSLEIDGVDWEGYDVDRLVTMGRALGHLRLKGRIAVVNNYNEDPTDKTLSEEHINALHEIFGNNCFSPEAELYISAPAGVYITGPDELRDFQEAEYTLAMFGGTVAQSRWALSASISGVTFDNAAHKLKTTALSGSNEATLGVTIITEDGGIIQKQKTVRFRANVYPDKVTVTGDKLVDARKPGRFTFDFEVGRTDAQAVDGEYLLAFTATSGNSNIVATIAEQTENTVTLEVTCTIDTEATGDVSLGWNVKKKGNNSQVASGSGLATVSCIFNVLGNPIMTKASNPKVMAAFYRNGNAASPNYMTDVEAALVTTLPNELKLSYDDGFSACTFHEFRYFIGIDQSKWDSYGCSFFKEISFPFTDLSCNIYLGNCNVANFPNLKTVSTGTICGKVTSMTFPKLESIASSFIYKYNRSYSSPCQTLERLSLPKLKRITSGGCFAYAPDLIEIEMPELEEINVEVTYPTSYSDGSSSYHEPANLPVFYNCAALQRIYAPKLSALIKNAFWGLSALSDLTLDFAKITELKDGTFCGCKALTTLSFPALKILNGKWFFYGCSNLATFEAPLLESLINTDSMIYKECFNGCSSLKILSLPSLKNIEGGKIFGSSAIEVLNLPSLERLHVNLNSGYFVGNMSNLREMYIGMATAPNVMVSNVSGDVPEGTAKTLYVPAGATGYEAWIGEGTDKLNGWTISYTL